MLDGLREFFRSKAGLAVAGAIVMVGLVAAVQSLRGFGSTDASAIARERMFIDAATGEPFEHELKIGDVIPTRAPSGQETGYPAEACYWTKDGKEKKEPTYVLLNMYKNSNEPTFCPDCDRLVVGHNPRPGEGVIAPPTKEEYMKRPRGPAGRRQ